MTTTVSERPEPVVEAGRDASRRPALWQRPPGLVFHLSLLLPAALLLLGPSYPSNASNIAATPNLTRFATVVSAPFVAVWVVRIATYLWALRNRCSAGSASWLLLAPAVLVIVVATAATDLPLRARFALSRSAFESVVADSPVSTRSISTSSPTAESIDMLITSPDDGHTRRVGAYEVNSAYRYRGATVFEVMFQYCPSAGFVYVPSGPVPDLRPIELERATFRDLGHGWYSFAETTCVP